MRRRVRVAESRAAAIDHIVKYVGVLVIAGLMTIGAPEDFTCFDRLAASRIEVAAALGVDPSSLALSMGMSGDYEAAIARGATNVRVGSTIFGARLYQKSNPNGI